MMFYFVEVQAQRPIISATPSSPQIVLEGTTVILEWTYNLSSGSFRQMSLSSPSVSPIVLQFLQDPLQFAPGFDGRFSANVTDTLSSITFLSVTRTDSSSYTFTIQSSGGFSNSDPVELIVQCKYNVLTAC